MQSGGGAAAGHGRSTAASASASPTSSSSAVSAPHLGLDPIQLQHRQSYLGGGLLGAMGGGNFVPNSGSMQLPQQSRKFTDISQQQMLTPAHQAYLEHAYHTAQQQSAMGLQPLQETKFGMVGPSGKDHDMRISDQRSDPKPPISQTSGGQLVIPGNMRSVQAPSQQSIQHMATNQQAVVAQMQTMQALALAGEIDFSLPANVNLMAQLIPHMQSRMGGQNRANESNMGAQSSSSVPMPNPQVGSPRVSNESSPHGNNSSGAPSGQSSSVTRVRQSVPSGPFGASTASLANNPNNISVQQSSVHSRENQPPTTRQTNRIGNGMPPMHPPQSSVNLNQGLDQSVLGKSKLPSPESLQMQYTKPIHGSSSQPAASSSEGQFGNHLSSQGGTVPQAQQQHLGFTKQQEYALKAQILALRRLKKGDGTLPRELLQAITPPPLETQAQQALLPVGTVSLEPSAGENVGVEDHRTHMESSEKAPLAVRSATGPNNLKGEAFAGDEKLTSSTNTMQDITAVLKEPTSLLPPGKEEHQTTSLSAKPEDGVDCGIEKDSMRSEISLDKGKAVAPQVSLSETVQLKKSLQIGNAPPPKDIGTTRKYHGPLFDFPFFTRKHDTFGSPMMVNNNNNMSLAYDVKDLLLEEGREVLNKKRTKNMQKIGNILAVNLERKRIRPDLILKLQIEEKKLKLLDLQARLRDEIDQQQQDIMAMPDRPYRKFVRLCQRQRTELNRQAQASRRAIREKQLKLIFQWRKKLLEAHWAIRDARTARNKGVAKYHERMLREFSKNKDDDRNRRMEALKNNDVERYREMLLEQQTSIPGDGAERYAVLSSFLTQTEEYLHKLGSKITASKSQQEVEEAANAAAAAARTQGLTEEEVRAAAACAGEEVTIRNRFSEMNAPRDSSSVNKYYNLAHAVNERVLRQPSMLQAGTLRDYQLVGLQWMLSLYNNKLNGILADEMGLGKTVQVMALIAHLMEFKSNNGPHLIIVPNAVLVNWKSELHNWIPRVTCIYYVGTKEQRLKLFSQEVCAMKFNVLVTTYEFVMFDRSKLSKVDWKYIIIDEAQRMKDRESVLARDLDRYRCQRRLLLTGTPLQNDLKELWSLLNLLLPEVFDNRKAFHDWFSKPFQKEGPTHDVEDDWLETEKKVIIIHRLHQILEPFMLRRRVEDVEGSLPPKVSVRLRCRMSGIQSAIYDWIKSTGTLKVDPEDEKLIAAKKPMYQCKAFKTLFNRCMELRKTCNHPYLNYPAFNCYPKDFLVRSCGKLFVLDRILVKLQRTGHRVLLFSTMTRLLDILEEYLQWRRLVYERIDGSTSLEDRESAIVEFNRPDTNCFIFLLSIRAAGRGLNLQSADTVIIYDPDPNPKNEEQAVARAHRIGQKREVKVIYLEAVVDKISSHQKEDECRSGGAVDSEDDLAGKDRYMGSIEGLIRNNIQQYKIDMADEVINAGRFDQRTTHEERRLTLESMLHDEERYQDTVHDVPSLQEVNRMIARSEEEVELFDQMDEEFDWEEEMMSHDRVPEWLRASTKEVNATVASLSKKKSLKNIFSVDSVEVASNVSERKRGRPRKIPIYTEVDEDDDFFEASSEEKNGYSGNEEGQIGDLEDEELVDQSEEDGPVSTSKLPEEAGSSGSSSGSKRLMQKSSPSISAQKFGSLSALDGRPSSISRRLPGDLEEGEIPMSGDSVVDPQQSGSWIHDRDEGEDEQVLQPKIKRKRSIRARPRLAAAERPEEKPSDKKASLLRQDPPNAYRQDKSESSLKTRGDLHSRKVSNPNETIIKMSDGVQRRCKNVMSKFQRRIDKEGHKIVPLLTDLWKRSETSAGNSLLDVQKIDQRLDKFEYDGVMSLISDVQLMLKSAVQYYGLSHEVRTEARKVHDLFFDVLKLAFPDMDFRDARSAVSFAGQVATTSTSAPPSRQNLVGQGKRQKQANEVGPDPSPPQKPLTRGPVLTSEETRTRRETRFGSSSNRELGPEEDSHLTTHPGELVICKGKRKDREKSTVIMGNRSASPVSPASIGRNIKSPGSGSNLRETRLSQHASQQQGSANQPPLQQLTGGGGGTFGWANPVKRMRTDAGKRRPSHL